MLCDIFKSSPSHQIRSLKSISEFLRTHLYDLSNSTNNPQKLKTEKQLPQRELARLAKVSHDSIRNWEGHRFFPKKESLVKLFLFFQVDEETLLSFKQ